jgi:hypothetical protein
VNPDILASWAILISAWRASGEFRVTETTADSKELLDATGPICDLVAAFEQRSANSEVHESFEALGRVRDDAHARSVLQRHLAAELDAEPAHLAHLLRVLLESGTVSSHDGFTRIDMPRRDDEHPGPGNGTLLSIKIPHPEITPARLTPPAHRLLGRDVELERVLSTIESDSATVQRVAVSAVAAGFGTTEFARCVADAMYRGKSARLQLEISVDQTKAPEDALSDALAALGVAARDVPAPLDQRAACYRAALAREAERAATRPLILLDDVVSLRQVEPFIPACPATVVMTGDHLDSRLRDDRITVIQLGPLDEPSSLRLLASQLNPGHAPFATAPGNDVAVRRLARLCEGVPLALAVIAGVIESVAASPHGPDPLAPLAIELERARYGLESVPVAERPVFAALRVSYAHLSAEQRRVLQALALIEVPRFDLNLIAAAGGLPPRAARDTASRFVGFALLETVGPAGDRWRMHRLVRRFIRDLLPPQVIAEPAQIITAAADLYLRRARSLSALLRLRAAQSDPAIAAWAREQLRDQQLALASLLRAALANGLANIAHQLAVGIAELIERGGEGAETIQTVTSVLATARQEGDRDLEARAHRIFAQHAERRGATRQARESFNRADALSDADGTPAAGGEACVKNGPSPAEAPSASATLPRQNRQAAGDRAEAGGPGEEKGPDLSRRDSDGPDRNDDDGPDGRGEGDGWDGPDPDDPDKPGGGGPDGGGPGPGGRGGGPRAGGGPGGSGPYRGGGPAISGGGAQPGASPLRSSPPHATLAAARGGSAPTSPTTFGSSR